MGQITNPIVKGITVNVIDRQSGPNAGAGATGNNSLFLGAGAGANSAVGNLIVLGHGSGGGGLVDPGDLAGTTIVGVNSLQSLVSGAGTGFPLTVVGSNNANALLNADSTVIIGSGNLSLVTASAAAMNKNVFIGNKIMPTIVGATAASINSNVMIGFQILAGANATGNIEPQDNILIGTNICPNVQAGAGFQNNIIIGANGGQNLTTTTSANILIGINTTGSTGGSNNVIIGPNSGQAITGGGGDQSNVMVGATCITTGSFNTVLGSRAQTSALTTNFGSVSIGANAGTSIPATVTNSLIIESSTALGGGTGNAPSTLMYGIFGTGNLVLGQSISTTRDFGGVPGTNMLKLLNGTLATGAAITNGGYFNVTGGVLSWIDQNGITTQLSNTASGQLDGAATVPYTNNAGANVGTLTNSPLTGNPTKWIPINDNGTIRNVPAW